MAPLQPEFARKATSFHETIIRDNSQLIVPIFATVTLGGGWVMSSEHVATGIITMILSGLAFGSVVVPTILRQALSRFRLDRPAPGQAGRR
jgi:hypothetical protein